MLQSYGKKKWEKGTLPERGRLSALSSELTPVISEELQRSFTTFVLTSFSPAEHIYGLLQDSCIFLYYSFHLFNQDSSTSWENTATLSTRD